MKKALTVSIVLIMVLVLFSAQNGLAQKDPFEIGKEIAMAGDFYSNYWAKDVGRFAVTYYTERNEVAFEEYPESGTGTGVWWIKDLGSNTYSRLTFIVKNNKSQQKTDQEVSISKEKAEQEAWRILGQLGYSKQNDLAQEDLFKIGKDIAMKGDFDSPYWTHRAGRFAVSYDIERNEVAFEEYPVSGTGTGVFWIKDLGSNEYIKFTCIAENYKAKKSQQVSITKEEAEEGARRVLRNLGYLKY